MIHKFLLLQIILFSIWGCGSQKPESLSASMTLDEMREEFIREANEDREELIKQENSYAASLIESKTSEPLEIDDLDIDQDLKELEALEDDETASGEIPPEDVRGDELLDLFEEELTRPGGPEIEKASPNRVPVYAQETEKEKALAKAQLKKKLPNKNKVVRKQPKPQDQRKTSSKKQKWLKRQKELIARKKEQADKIKNQKTKVSRFAIIKAAGLAPKETLKRLLELGNSINIQNRHGHSALMRAVQNSRIENVKFLLEMGADKNLRNKSGKTALDIAVEKKLPKIIRLLN